MYHSDLFFGGFALSTYIDYAAWKFKRERLLIKPYLELVSMVEGHFNILSEQIHNAISRLEHLSFERAMQEEVENQKLIRESLGQLGSISKSAQSLNSEFAPLLEHWTQTIEKSNRLTWRLRARFISLWTLDIILPLALATTAIWRTFDGVSSIVAKLVS